MLTKFDLYSNRTFGTDELYAYFDSLQPFDMANLRGKWEGVDLDTNHHLNLLLTYCDWYGKDFIDEQNVDGLIFREKLTSDRCFRVDPKLFPIGTRFFPNHYITRVVFTFISKFIQTQKSTAKLEMIEYRGKRSASVVYNDIKMVDYYRKIDSRTILGVIESKAYKDPFFYVLQKDENSTIYYR